MSRIETFESRRDLCPDFAFSKGTRTQGVNELHSLQNPEQRACAHHLHLL
jgi:hypothetical protein